MIKATMDRARVQGNLVLINGAITVGIAIPHLIDDFLFGVRQEFGLSNVEAQVLAGVFAAMLIAVFSLAARGERWGFGGTGCLGGFLALAGILKRIPRMLEPGPYWGGLFSEILIGALIISGVSLLVISLLAWRHVDSQRIDVLSTWEDDGEEKRVGWE
jgi:hypothetical protein